MGRIPFDTTSSSSQVSPHFSLLSPKREKLRMEETFADPTRFLLPRPHSSDPFSAFENSYPELVAIDSQGVARSKVDLFQKEAFETMELTRAQEVSPGFWVSGFSSHFVEAIRR